MLAPTLSGATRRRSVIAAFTVCCMFCTAPVRASGVRSTMAHAGEDSPTAKLGFTPTSRRIEVALTHLGAAMHRQ
jgi:hypothetical protein